MINDCVALLLLPTLCNNYLSLLYIYNYIEYLYVYYITDKLKAWLVCVSVVCLAVYDEIASTCHCVPHNASDLPGNPNPLYMSAVYITGSKTPLGEPAIMSLRKPQQSQPSLYS